MALVIVSWAVDGSGWMVGVTVKYDGVDWMLAVECSAAADLYTLHPH